PPRRILHRALLDRRPCTARNTEVDDASAVTRRVEDPGGDVDVVEARIVGDLDDEQPRVAGEARKALRAGCEGRDERAVAADVRRGATPVPNVVRAGDPAGEPRHSRVSACVDNRHGDPTSGSPYGLGNAV